MGLYYCPTEFTDPDNRSIKCIISLCMEIGFVLVEPALPENVGAAARAIKTMGFRQLILVNPCEWREGKARWVAHGSGDILDNALVFDSVEKAVEGFDFRIATTVRHRRIKEDVTVSGKLLNFLREKGDTVKKAAVLFGREESGLSNDEIKLCDIVSEIPMIDKYPSLNLAQAVMIYAYELSGFNLMPDKRVAANNGINFPALKLKISRILKSLGLSETDCRYGRIMERAAYLNESDMNLVFTICKLFEEQADIP